MGIDITEGKQAEEARKKSEERYRIISRLSSEFAYSCVHTGDDGYKVDWITDAFFTLTGYTEAELHEKGCWMFISHPDDHEMATEPLQELKAGESDTREFRIVTRDGRILYIINHMECRADPDTPGGLRLFGAVQDITDRKNVEVELLATHDQLRNLAARLQMTREDERKNIAVEIHDDLGQSLTALQIDLSWLIKRMPHDQKKLLEKAESMLRLVKVTDEKAREIATELRPPLLDDLGFVPAAQSYLSEFEEKTGITCDFFSEPEGIILDANVSIALFRVLQGTLINTAKHAKATRIKLSLAEQTDGLYMKISDNGRGITQKELASRKSIGIMGMRERIAYIGGSLQIEGRPGKGTTVKVKIPVQGGHV